MTVEVVCALIVLCGTVASGVLSWFVSRSSADREIKKMRLNWEHETLLSSDDSFAEMVASVAALLQSQQPCDFDTALARVAAIRSKEIGSLGAKLDELYRVLYQVSPNSGEVEFRAYSSEYRSHLDQADQCLSEVINEKRKRKSAQRGDGGDHPVP